MDEYLYRYISFESFVDLIQTKELAFCLPSTWDDTREMYAYKKAILKMDNAVERILLFSSLYNIYAQCWTKLDESDAMWRIYNYSNMTIRIKVKREKFKLLGKNIEIKDVEYIDNFEEKIDNSSDDLINLLALKRKAFSHEKEVRIIDFYRFTIEDAKDRLKTMMILFDDKSRWDYFKDKDEKEIDKIVTKYINKTNANMKKNIKRISFSHIDDFIEDVMLHPLSPQWFVDTVEKYCQLNNIKFVGKSKLYED